MEDRFGRLAGPGGGAGLWGPALGLAGTGWCPRHVVGLPLCVGGGGTPCWFSWWLGCVPGVFVVPGCCLQPCPTAPAVHACWPLPTTSGLFPHPARVTALCSLPLSGAELASPHVGVVPRPLLASGIPEAGWCVGSLVCVCVGHGGCWCVEGDCSPWLACGSWVCVGGGGCEHP